MEVGNDGLQFKADACVGGRIAGNRVRNHPGLDRDKARPFQGETVMLG